MSELERIELRLIELEALLQTVRQQQRRMEAVLAQILVALEPATTYPASIGGRVGVTP